MQDTARILGSILPVALLTLVGGLVGGLCETQAATYYVDGGCQYSGNGLADQCASAAGQPGAKKAGTELNAILNSAACGDTVVIKGAHGSFNGIYSNPAASHASNFENGAFNVAGKNCTSSAPLIIEGADRNNKPRLCHHADCSYSTEEVPAVYMHGSTAYVVLDGLRVDGVTYVYAEGRGTIHDVEIRYCEFTTGMINDGNFGTLYVLGATNAWIHHNYFHDLVLGPSSSFEVFYRTYRDTSHIVEYNTFRRGSGVTPDAAIYFKESPRNSHIRYNDIEGGISVHFQRDSLAPTGTQVYGNVLHEGPGFSCGGSGGGGGTIRPTIQWSGDMPDGFAYNNTFVGTRNEVFDTRCTNGNPQLSVTAYNNITVGSMTCPNVSDCTSDSAVAFAICMSPSWGNRAAYNLNHNIYPAGAHFQGGGTSFTSLASWAAQVGGGEAGSQTAACSFVSNTWPGDYHIAAGTPCKTASSTGGEVGAYGCTTCPNYTGCVGHTCGATAPTPVCGNGVKEGSEVCDGSDLGGATCSSQGFYCGTLQCNSTCTGLVTASCVSGGCGDGQIQSACGEHCDGSALGGQSCQGLGFEGGTLTCSSGCAFVTSACTSASPSLECANWQTAHPDWIWCDDFEYANDSALLSSYDDSGVAYSSPLPAMGVSSADRYAGSKSLRFHYVTGAVDVGYLWRHFGRNPAGSNYSNATDFTDVYWRFYMKLQAGWTGQPQKITRGSGFYRSDRSQTFVAHFWQDQNPQGNGTSLDPVSCVSGSTPACSGYNNLNNFTWLGERDGADRHFYDTANAGVWRCMEFHAKLNTPGASDGVQEYWIDGALQAGRNDLNFRGSYAGYGINAVQIEAYWNSGAAATEDKYYDNFVISRQRIGCSSAPMDTTPPADVQNVTRTDKK